MGWVASKEESTGRVFYYNEVTNESQWEKPRELWSQDDHRLAEAGWIEYTSEEGKVYWHNSRTNNSVWERPQLAQKRHNSLDSVQKVTKLARNEVDAPDGDAKAAFYRVLEIDFDQNGRSNDHNFDEILPRIAQYDEFWAIDSAAERRSLFKKFFDQKRRASDEEKIEAMLKTLREGARPQTHSQALELIPKMDNAGELNKKLSELAVSRFESQITTDIVEWGLDYVKANQSVINWPLSPDWQRLFEVAIEVKNFPKYLLAPAFQKLAEEAHKTEVPEEQQRANDIRARSAFRQHIRKLYDNGELGDLTGPTRIRDPGFWAKIDGQELINICATANGSGPVELVSELVSELQADVSNLGRKVDAGLEY